MDRFYSSYSIWAIAFFLIAFGFSSCKAPREISKANIKPLSTQKLLKNQEENSLAYESLSIGRINCQFTGNQSKTSFRISLNTIRDEKILASITKLNIPVGRVLLTPDSVIYVNYIEKNYFVDDYSFLSNFLNIDLDFNTIQAIISNDAFSYRNDEKDRDFKTFTTSVESGMYVLQSEKEKKVFRMEEKGRTGKIERRLKRLDDNALILQKMYFNPTNFALTKLLIEDKTNRRKMEMNFDEFVKVLNKDYPGTINMSFVSGSDSVFLKVRMSGFSTEKIDSLYLKIPEKYQQIRVN
ncbi:MAG: hypothetical protein FD181_404 [Prolixibacteraceae bacterium]|nr:MAG: hypothetical protein FD181_404 [Prolixibacteraceae bacterium]